MISDSHITEGRERERVFADAEQGIQQQVFDKLAEWESEQKNCRLITTLDDLRFRQALATVGKAHRTFECREELPNG